MDILLAPKGSPPIRERTRFVGADNWDCGPFLAFAARTGNLSKVPLARRGGLDPSFHVPYTELLYPSPQEENESFYLTWFYIGLVAECLGLNEGPARLPNLGRDEAEQRCAELYKQVVDVGPDDIDNGGGRTRFVNGAQVYQVLEPRLKRLMLASAEEEKRLVLELAHLHECLLLTFHMMSAVHSAFDPTIMYSIAALGEVVTMAAQAAYAVIISRCTLAKVDPPPELKQTPVPWGSKYLNSNGRLVSDMIAAGWCPSEVERVCGTYRGIGTTTFLSKMDRSLTAARDHSACSKLLCKAYQIDLKTYKLSHAVAECVCEKFVVDVAQVQHVLRARGSFPILRFDQHVDGVVKLAVEEYEPGVQYVALSHVWADGLGNPRENAIQSCQVARLFRLIEALQRDMGPSASQANAPSGGSYRLWIDTLCCPVEPSGKMVALQRIADVYRKATHVLVLDSHISSYPSNGASPAETLLRIFGTSSWMRRLWTLQEGALSQSLCFQFSDRAVRDRDLAADLRKLSLVDPRLFQMAEDVRTELQRIHTFFTPAEIEAYRKGFASVLSPHLFILQYSLYFRTVTVPSDEPLCLATLFSLDIGAVAAAETSEDRMALVWKSLAHIHGGIPPGVIFVEDKPLAKAGFRWAPSSLLGSSTLNSFITLNDKATRFTMPGMDASHLGIPTPRGLRVRFGGLSLKARPHAPGFPLHPWDGLIKVREDTLYIQDTTAKTWYQLTDAEILRLHNSPNITEEDMSDWFSQAGERICCAMHSGDAALILNSAESRMIHDGPGGEARIGLLVHLNKGDDEGGDTAQDQLHVHSLRGIVLQQLGDAEVTVASGLQHLARSLVLEEFTSKLMNAPDKDSRGPQWQQAKEEAKTRMRQAAMEYWDERPEFAEAVEQTVGSDMKEYFWAMIPKQLSHEILLEWLPAEQTWVVD